MATAGNYAQAGLDDGIGYITLSTIPQQPTQAEEHDNDALSHRNLVVPSTGLPFPRMSAQESLKKCEEMEEEMKQLRLALERKTTELDSLTFEKNEKINELLLTYKNAQDALILVKEASEMRLEEIQNSLEEKVLELAEKDRQVSDKDRRLIEKDQQLSEKDHQLEEKDHQLEEKDHQLEEKDHQLEEKDHQLEEKDHQLKEKGHQLEEKDHQLEEKDHHLAAKDQQLIEKDQLLVGREKEVQQLKRVIEDLRVEVQHLTSEKTNLEANVTKLERKIAELNQEMSSIRNENDELRQNMSECIKQTDLNQALQRSEERTLERSKDEMKVMLNEVIKSLQEGSNVLVAQVASVAPKLEGDYKRLSPKSSSPSCETPSSNPSPPPDNQVS